MRDPNTDLITNSAINQLDIAYESLGNNRTDVIDNFEKAWLSAGENSDVRVLACAGALTTYFAAWSNMRGLKQWVQRFSEVNAQSKLSSTMSLLNRLRLSCGRLCATRLVDESVTLDVLVEEEFLQALQLIREHLSTLPLQDVAVHVPILAEMCPVLRRSAEAHEIERLIHRDPRFDTLSAILRGRFWDWLAAAYFVLDDHAQYTIAEQRVTEIAETESVDELAFDLRKRPIRNALEANDIEKAKILHSEMRTYFNPSHVTQAAEFWDLDGRIKLATHDFSGAADSYRRAIASATEGAAPQTRFIILWLMLGTVYVAMDDEKNALHECKKAIDATSGTQQVIMRASFEIVVAWFAWKKGTSEATTLLKAALTEAARLNLVRFLRQLPTIAAKICHAGLELGVEIDFCKRAIQSRGLPPPSICGAVWPHAYQITSFGGFHIAIAGSTLPSQAKPQVKPIALLRVLAANEGLPLPVARVVSMLWPDANPETARASFDNALGRLKKIIGRDDVVRLDSGKLIADAAQVWFDTKALSEIALQIETSRETNSVLIMRHANRLLQLYSGLFQQNEDDDPWLLVARERFQQRFLRAADIASQSLERNNEYAAALSIYQRVLDAEPAAENIYRRLMQCYLNLGNHAEALQTYRRCQRMLLTCLGVSPSAQTEALSIQIYSALNAS